jgi:predicted nucleic acid-binding protein
MGRLGESLADGWIIGLDTTIFIYHFEANPAYLPLTSELLQGVESGKWSAVTSIITLMEINVRPLQLGRLEVARRYEALLVNFPHLTIMELNREIARQAAQLRAEHRLRPADAFQAAACLAGGCKALLTNDRDFQRLESIFEILILDDFIAS